MLSAWLNQPNDHTPVLKCSRDLGASEPAANRTACEKTMRHFRMEDRPRPMLSLRTGGFKEPISAEEFSSGSCPTLAGVFSAGRTRFWQRCNLIVLRRTSSGRSLTWSNLRELELQAPNRHCIPPFTFTQSIPPTKWRPKNGACRLSRTSPRAVCLPPSTAVPKCSKP